MGPRPNGQVDLYCSRRRTLFYCQRLGQASSRWMLGL